MVFLFRKPRHANEENLIVGETHLCPPFISHDLRASVVVCWNTVCDDPALRNPVELFQAERYFSRNGNRDHSVVEGVTLNALRPRLNLAFRKIVNRVHNRRGPEKQ